MRISAKKIGILSSLLFSIVVFSFAAVDTSGLSFWDSFSVRVYCATNNLLLRETKCNLKQNPISIDLSSLKSKKENPITSIVYVKGPKGEKGDKGDTVYVPTYQNSNSWASVWNPNNGTTNTFANYQYVPVGGGGTSIISHSISFDSPTNILTSSVNGVTSTTLIVGLMPCVATGTGIDNTCYGQGALQQNTTGSNNTSLGYFSGNNITSGSNNITLGANTNVYSPTSSGQLNIGNALFGYGLSGSLSSPAGILSVGTSSVDSISTGGNRGLVIDSGISNTSGLRLANLAASSSVGLNSYILGAAISWPIAIAMDSAGNIYTANINSNNVTKITPDGVVTILGTTGSLPSDIVVDSSGNVYVSNSGSDDVTKITSSGVSSVFATTGSGPVSIVMDQSGNIYTANSTSNNISKITPSGVSTIFATTGSGPNAMVFDASGNMYVANTLSSNVSKITPSGVSTIFATTGTFPNDITIDQDGNLYTANQNSNNVTKITPSGATTTIGLNITHPMRLKVDSDGNIYVVSGVNNYDKIIKLSSAGAVSYIDIPGNGPGDLLISTVGDIYTANSWSSNVTKVVKPPVDNFLTTDILGNVILSKAFNSLSFSTTSKILSSSVNGMTSSVDLSGLTSESLWSKSGTSSNIYNSLLGDVAIGTSTITSFTTGAAKGLIIDSGTPNTSGLRLTNLSPYISGVSSIIGTTASAPLGVVYDSFGNIYTANSSSNNVTKITPSGVSTILGTTGASPYAITIDSDGNIYTANSGSNNVTKITPSGVSTILGTTGSGPYNIAIDSNKNIYTSNYNDNNVTKITPSGVSTILGTTGSGPYGITVASDGNIYTVNANDNTVSKITPSGVSTILGNTGSGPQSIVSDSYNNIYVANYNDSNVSKITQLGVSTILGNTGSGPDAIAIDSFGNIYTANQNSNDVTKITQTGVSSVVGTTGSSPSGVVVDTIGNVYVSNQNSNNISKIVSSDLNVLSTDSNGNVILAAVVSQNLLSNTIYSLNQRIANNSPITIVNDSNLFSTGLTGTGSGVASSTNSIFLGAYAGYQALSASSSNFLGFKSGYNASNANNSNFFGQSAGSGAINASYSNLFGYRAGSNNGGSIGSNNIIIGTNISLPNGVSNAINIGGILFGTGTYSDTTSSDTYTSPFMTGRIGIGEENPIAGFQVSNFVSASSSVARGVYVNNTLTATNNNDTLIGLDINPTYNNAGFSNITQLPLRVVGPIRFVASTSTPSIYGDWGYNANGFFGSTDTTSGIRSGNGKYYGNPFSPAAYFNVGYYGDNVVLGAWPGGNWNGFSLDQPNISAVNATTSRYSSKLLNFTGTMTYDASAVLAGTLTGLYTKLGDNSSTTLVGTLNGVYSDVSGGTNPNTIRNSGIFVGGNVGINTTLPQYSLDVGNASSTGIIARFTNNNGSCTLDNTGLSCPSDINLKKNITKLSDNTPFTLSTINLVSTTTLDKITALDSVMYNWKGESDTSNKHIGFIAQQVEQLFPDLVTIDNKTNLRTLNYSNFAPYLLESIKELSNKSLFASVGSSTLVNNTLQSSLNDLSLFISSTTDQSIASTTLLNLHDLFSSSSLSAIKALTNTLTQTGFDLNLNGNALRNVKSIESMSGNWRVGEDGLITAKTVRTEGLELKDSDGNWYCYASQNGSLVKVGSAPCTDSELGNFGSSNTQTSNTSSASSTDTATTTDTLVDTSTTTPPQDPVITQDSSTSPEIIP